MELLALHNPIKKPPRSDERDGELFCGIPFQTATYTSTSARYSKPVATTSETFTATDDCIYCIRLSCSLAANTFTLSTTGQTLTISGNNTNNASIAVLLAAGQSVTYQFHINQSGGGSLEYWKII